jgi:hypothetical protein
MTMPTIADFPEDLLDEHHNWHSPSAHSGVYPGRRHPAGTPGGGREFLMFHHDFMERFHEWYDVQASADQSAVAPWTSVPAQLKSASLGWNATFAEQEQRLITLSPSFANSDELGAFIESGIHNQFLHGATAQHFNEPLVGGPFQSPQSTYFYKIHGLVSHWWSEWQKQNPNERRIHAFVVGQDGHLHVNYWDGNSWHWADQGAPPGTAGGAGLGAITYQEAGPQRLYTFQRGLNGRLYVNYWDGNSWHWADQGTFPGQSMSAALNLSAITYWDGVQRIYCFGRAENGHLHVNYWTGGSWHWADQGAPPGTTMIGQPSAVTYRDGSQRIYVFLRGADGHLRINYWTGATWKWADQGAPAGTTLSGGPAAITFREGLKQRLYGFVRGQNGHLLVNYWDGNSWHWADQGKPAGTDVVGDPTAITYRQAGTQRIYVFARGSNGHLAVNYWDGNSWHWADQGAPAGTTVTGVPNAITYNEGGVQRIYVFVRGANGHLLVNYWDGNSWHWADQGTPAGTVVSTSGELAVTTYMAG